MIKKLLTISGTTLLLAFTAMAADEVPKFEVSADYSFAHFDPARNFFKTKNLNGGGGAFTLNFGNYFGVKADFQGYGSSNFGYTLPSGVTLPNGTVTTSPTAATLQGNLFTYTFGPVIKKHTGVFQPFGEVLLGAAHSNAYANVFKDIYGISRSNNNNGFAMVVGGGLDLRLNRTITLRPAEVDYLLTRFGSNYVPPASTGLPSISTQNQNSFRYLAGVDFTFGGGK